MAAARRGGPDYAQNIRDVTGPQLSDNRDGYVQSNAAQAAAAAQETAGAPEYQVIQERSEENRAYKSSSEDVVEELTGSGRLAKSMRKDL